MDAMQVLVIILSVFLAIFLVSAIVLIVQLIRVTKQIRMIASTTQSAVDRVSNLASTAGKIISPAFIAKFVTDQFKKYNKKNKSKED
jgi:inner membrane protein involved in colicin E2 resistance